MVETLSKMKNLFFILSVFILLSCRGQEVSTFQENREVAPFNAVVVSNMIEVEIKNLATPYIRVETNPEKFVSQIQTEVVDGELTIGVIGNINNFKKLKVYVGISALEKVETKGMAKVRILDDFQSDNFELNLSSQSNFKAPTLSCNSMKLKTESMAKADFEVQAEKLVVEATSMSTTTLSGKVNHLELEMKGMSKIYAKSLKYNEGKAFLQGQSKLSIDINNMSVLEVDKMSKVR